MGHVRVVVDSDAAKEVAAIHPRYHSAPLIVEQVQQDAFLAGQLADRAYECLKAVFAPRRDKKKKDAWRSDPLICAYFGEDALTIRQMRRTRERMQRARKRFKDRTLTIAVKPQITRQGYPAIGHNTGGPLTPLRFKIFADYFRDNDEQRAASLIHETLHDWHFDKAVRDPDLDERVPAYYDKHTRLIAVEKPRQARRNPDNYARFALAVSGYPPNPVLSER